MEKVVFHIGELSNLFNISVDSIRYYEKMGLITPVRNPDNGYREYTMDDFETIVIIRELLGLGFHMEQISEFIKGRNIGSTLSIMDTEIDIINKSIMELNAKKQSIINRMNMVKSALKLPLDGKVYKHYIDERHVIMVSEENLPDYQVDYSVVRFMKEYHKDINLIGYCDCYTLDIEHSNPMSDYYRTKNVFFMSDDITSFSNHKLERGDYLSLSYQGNLKNTKKYMPKLFKYAEERGLTVKGSPIEICRIDNYETLNEEEFIIEIQMAVEWCNNLGY